MCAESGIRDLMLLPRLVSPVEGRRRPGLILRPPQVGGHGVHLPPGKQSVPFAMGRACALWRHARVGCWGDGRALAMRLELWPHQGSSQGRQSETLGYLLPQNLWISSSRWNGGLHVPHLVWSSQPPAKGVQTFSPLY